MADKETTTTTNENNSNTTDNKEEVVETPNKTEQPEVKTTEKEEKQVAKDSEDTGEETDNKTVNKRVTKAELVAELEDLKEDMDTLMTKLADKDSAHAQMIEELESYKAKVKEMEKASEQLQTLLTEIVEAKKNSIPKEVQELMPDGTLEQQLAWLNKAEKSGLGSPKKEKPVVEIGKPMNMGVQTMDTSKMTPQQKLSSYFAQVFTK